MKTLPLAFLSGLITVGCATGKRESGNLAKVIAQQLREYGAELPHINLQQPAIGIDQMYSSWRWEGDSGGFTLTFRDGAFDGVLYQMRQIAGKPLPASDASVHPSSCMPLGERGTQRAAVWSISSTRPGRPRPAVGLGRGTEPDNSLDLDVKVMLAKPEPGHPRTC